MVNYSTEFPIDPKNTVEDVVRLACEWIAGSPHTKIPESALEHLPADQEVTYTAGDEQVTTAIAKLADFQIGGLRYIRTEDRGLVWTTSIVTLKSVEVHLLSLQVSCEALNTAVRLPAPKKPYFIRQALSELGGGMDGSVPVADRPFRLAEDEAHVAAALILGTANNRLPIVYVSASYKGEHLADPDKLAKFLSGTAHVVVEPNRNFSFQVKTLTSARNVYGGTIGVYWPESTARKVYFLDGELPDSRALQVEIANDIRVALSNRRLRTNCNWAYLKETLSRIRYDLLKAQGSTEVNQYTEAFDAELEAKEGRLREAEQEIARLNAELARYASTAQHATGGLLKPGKEQDLYENEITDIVVDALRDALRNSRPDSRRQHVLSDLIGANASTGMREKLEEEIKSLFKTYREMDARTRSALARLGFDVSEDGKHFKAVFQGDGRYTFVLPKTSSDHRGGRNLASDITNTLL
jgi:hypothetical protein